MINLQYVTIETDFGRFVLMQEADSGQLRSGWVTPADLPPGATEDPDLHPDLVARLRRYFAGEPVDFSIVETPAGPPFFRRCWDACRTIPPGETWSYATLAARAGSPGAARAAGQAMRHNPLPVIVPCHRVIGASGDLHGFGGSLDPSGDQLDLKQKLLSLESAAIGQCA